MIRAVTIDFWNTIVDSSNGASRRSHRSDALKRAFASAGRVPEETLVERAFQLSHEAFEDSWKNRHKTLGADEVLRIVWKELELDVAPEEHNRVVEAFEESVLMGLPALLPGAAETIRGLAEHFRLAIISDTALSPGTYLKRVLEEHGVLQYFSYCVFSDETGVSKPHERAFVTALDALGAAPEETVHIGDIEWTDIAGAKAAGMYAILFRGDKESFSYKSYSGSTAADAVAEHWNDLPAIIEALSESETIQRKVAL